MAESADGSPAGQIDVLYSLKRSGGSSSSAKKRRHREEQEEPSIWEKKAKLLLDVDEEEVDELEKDDYSAAPNHVTAFSARSAASTQYGFLTHPDPSDVDDAPLNLRAGKGRGKKGGSLFRAAMSRAALDKSRMVEVGEDEDEDASGGEGDDSVLIVSD
jgi:hypothetical protein